MAFKTEHKRKRFSKITINLASTDAIISRSFGEVLKPETINYRTFKPDKDGLFCEKIFGPVRDWECHCGKYKGIRYKGIVCDRCGVEINLKNVRRERMGHITLSVPVVHIWYFRSLPTKIGYVLGISSKELERIIYYETYVVINPGKTNYKKMQLITEDEYNEVLDSMTEDEHNLDDDDPKKFVAGQGGEAVKELLKSINTEEEIARLRAELKNDPSALKKMENIKRLRILEAFRVKPGGKPNKPEWMVLDVVPVIPPELRPLVPLEGGRFATSDLNDLYRRVIIRNNRLKRLIDIKAPEVILRNEKRMLQEAVDALLDNSRRVTAVKAENRALKSLSDILKGKQGRFRQNLLGKRVDYSGRTVIVVGPELKLHQCGLPKDMALELFKPFVIRRLIDRDYVKTVKSAKKLIDKRTPEVWDILENVIDGHPVLLNRAPTLHRLSIQAFQPVLIEGKAITLHPFVCIAFNADFDGDQMAVHVPLSYEAQLEAQIMMLSSHNILSPQNGAPITIPNQELILGCYYLTKELPGDLGEGKIFSSSDEVILAFDNKKVGMHARIKVRIKGEIIETTVGRVIFNRIVPEKIPFINELLKKKKIIEMINMVYNKVGNLETSAFLDNLKEIGFRYATLGGLSVNIDDIEVPKTKDKIIEEAFLKVDRIEKSKAKGIISENERYNKVIDIWTHVRDEVKRDLMLNLTKSKQGFNSLHMMIDSGARGSAEQVSQLAGMRGLMQKPQKSLTGQAGEIIENPIIANFKEGLSILEYFISTHGARKGLADTALKTADAGYLTRRLVDVAQDVIIIEEDCKTIRGVVTEALKEGEDVKETLSERILGRVAVNDVVNPLTKKVIIKAGELITEDLANLVAETPITQVEIRSVLTCELKRGVCAKCYGKNLATGKMVEVGEAVGIVAAQSIGEPGTQLTLRTFHIGGTASKIISQSQITTKFEGKVKFENIKIVEYKGGVSTEYVSLSRNGLINIIDDNGSQLARYTVPYGTHLKVKDKEKVPKNAILYEWDPYNSVIVAEDDGIVNYFEMEEGKQYEISKDEQTGFLQKIVIESRDKTKSPTIQILNPKNDKLLSSYLIPAKASILVDNGAEVKAGTIIVKIPRESGKTRDITGGLPRVTELFEARSPSDPAKVAEINGTVEIGKISRGSREVRIISKDGSKVIDYKIPIGKHILVRHGDVVKSGEPLTGGAYDPVDILKIKGVAEVQEYLVNEIQEVYRIQGVKINDKHIEVIVRQMLQKVKVTDTGDTNFLEGDVVNKILFAERNEELKGMVVVTDTNGYDKVHEGQVFTKKEAKEMNAALKKKDKPVFKVRDAVPATAEPVLLGITQTSLTTESFISAASFQETTKVLTDAAIRGKVDNLLGLKENVIIGQLIPAGTGLRKYKDILVTEKSEYNEEEETPKKKTKKKKTEEVES
ncbi:MAG TPA: DNA-directed RNA polymerase subunit beta' [Ignavibacteria bacterium]|nr:DNA-directed RNA polymerase subunit beta' [Bacteroidota bacterium]HRI85577.1 DNA-directed RNA polymerase subunit beta' [Ignavibacteria bacterium]HRJ98887.1 DNA-directed RNA polymerase subunit beta' [Ignavibacteria bacterium]